MHRRFAFHTFIAAAAVLLVSATTGAGEKQAKFNAKVNVGDRAPAFQGLIGIDDEKRSLADYKQAQIVVLSFTCNHCPVAKAYEDRFIEFTKEFKDKGVAFVAISVSNAEADKLPAMKERAIKKGFNFDYLHDETQQVGRDYGATVTPHVFVLGKDRRIAYMGAFDDSMNLDRVQYKYVHDAVAALLEGKQPEIAESKQFGCGIVYEKQ